MGEDLMKDPHPKSSLKATSYLLHTSTICSSLLQSSSLSLLDVSILYSCWQAGEREEKQYVADDPLEPRITQNHSHPNVG